MTTVGSGSGFQQAGFQLRSVANAMIHDVKFSTAAFDGVEHLSGYVEGVMRNVWHFQGVHVLDCDRFNAANWWYHHSTYNNSWRAAEPTSLTYDAEVRVRGSAGKTIGRLILAQSNPANPVPIAVRYRISNPGNLTIVNPDTAQNKAFFPTGNYNAVAVNGGVASRLGRSTSLAPTDGAITPIFEYHPVNPGAVVSDILGPNGGAPYDGQVVRLRMNGGTGTLRHNAGVAGTRIFCRSGVDTAIPAVGWGELSYNAAAGRWETDF